MLVHQFVERAARSAPDAIALLELQRAISYRELDALANQFGHVYLDAGVRRGDRVVLAMENGIDLVAAYFGALKAGAVAVPLPGGPRSDRLGRAIADCTPRVCILDVPSARETVNGARSRTAVFVTGPKAGMPDGFTSIADALTACASTPLSVRSIDRDLAAIIYTSGSTGEPRGVMLTHRNLVTNAHSIVAYLELTGRDRVMCVLPFHYVYGLSLLHTHMCVGGSVAIDNRFAFPNVVLNAMKALRVTGFAGVPSSFALLLHRSSVDSVALPDLRYVTQAGGPMPPSRILEWLERGPRVPFYVMYGATEASARLTYLPPADLRRKLGSIGRSIPNVEMLVMTENGERARPGEVGELVARGANVAAGYWNAPGETSEKFGLLGYRTGDLGYADDEGFLFIVGRKHDMMKVGANRVGAREIEDVLSEHPAVHEVAVVSRGHDILGEVPVAFVSLRATLADAPQSLHVFCASRLAVHKVPEAIVVCAELPKLPGTGKIDKPTLRSMADRPLARPDMVRPK